MIANPFAASAGSNVIDTLFPDAEKKRELQTKFAMALLKHPDDAFKAGLEVFGADTGRALYAAQHWVADPAIEQIKTALVKAHGTRAFLPSKDDYAREVWKLAMNERTPVEDKRALLSLYGDIMGFKQQAERPGVNVNVMQQSVMVVKDHGTDAEWERQARAQQAALTRDNKQVVDVEPRH